MTGNRYASSVADHVAGPVDFLKVDVEGFEREGETVPESAVDSFFTSSNARRW